MPKEYKIYDTHNGNKYIQNYIPEGDNSAFKAHNGAVQRAIENRASIVAAARVGRKYSADNKEFEAWLKNPASQPEISKHIRIEFAKECERLALLPEQEIKKIREEESIYTAISNTKARNASYKETIRSMRNSKEI
ncbi:MAG: hypothetical protein IJX20_04875 [Alphaproteobacteria bacterium]|nr:hypothetical protein [Alphaproteobacteria bacterium]